jgi:hypothetical protein
MPTIHTTATIGFTYDTDDSETHGLVTVEDCIEDTCSVIDSGDIPASQYTVMDTTELQRAAQLAANAASGDSNDEEIDLLRDALEQALGALGLTMPESEETD